MTLRNGFKLGSWTIFPLEGRLVDGDVERRVQPKSMDVLLGLAEAAGDVVERDELLRDVWGGRAVSDEPLTRCIGELRRALNDSASEPEFILTVPKRGYRLLQQPLEIGRAPVVGPRGPRRLTKVLAISAVFIVLIGILIVLTGSPREDDSNDTLADVSPVSAHEPSIVVLPFLNLSSDVDQEFFSDGIAEELLNYLARFPDLRVIARSSAFSYKGSDVDARTVAQQLKVSHVLEGSVRKSGDRVRVTAQLIDAASNTQVWSETYERSLDDIFETQDDIATRVAEQLKLRLLGNNPTVREHNAEAYALVLQARYLGRQFTPESFEKAIVLLEHALALDPRYASAWDELGRMYRRQAGQGLRPSDEAYASSRSAVNRALSLDPALASAHRSMAVIALNFDRDPVSAAEHIKRAYRLEPLNASNLTSAAAMAGALGRLDDAIALQEHAVARDPVNSQISTYLGTLHLHAGRIDDAIAAYRATLILNPDYIGIRFLLGESLLLKGDVDAALDSMQEEPDEGYRLIGLVMVHHAHGDMAASNAALDTLIDKYERDAPYNIAYVLAFRGEPDRAFEWLNKAVAYSDPGLTEIPTDPLLVNIRKDPRWLPFLESVGKAPEQLAAIEFDIELPK